MAKKKSTRGKGRPGHQPTKVLRQTVEMMAAFGNTEDQISQILSITPPTLRKHYAAEIAHGFDKANNAVAMNLFRQATKDDVRSVNAAMFWLKMRAGWHEYMIPQQPKEPKPGKKEAADEAAKHPDTTTDMGELMARRAQSALN
jgi:hypothetical protein